VTSCEVVHSFKSLFNACLYQNQILQSWTKSAEDNVHGLRISANSPGCGEPITSTFEAARVLGAGGLSI
jgi:hypothetical protein